MLQPNDPDSYYASRELVPTDMLDDMKRAKIVITNYHAFKLRERIELSAGGRALLQGRRRALDTLETEGQMIQRVMPDLMGMKNVLVLNDEAHHCYREKPGEPTKKSSRATTRKRPRGTRKPHVSGSPASKPSSASSASTRVIDLSATPFFLRGSGYAEGTLFPWTMSDFSLMDAIECGIVKLPRVPVADNIPGAEMPMFRNLWENIRKKMPKKGRGKAENLDPLSLPTQLQTALDALYGHYEKTFEIWQEAGYRCRRASSSSARTPPSRSSSTTTSPASPTNEDGSTQLENGRLELFRNFDEHGNADARPNTLLIDSEQLESGEALDDNFRTMAADEIEQFRREIVERSGQQERGRGHRRCPILREVMNTVGKEGQLGGDIRCVVSVSMLTEGWDANTVTHVLGVRAFGTQFLCEQVIGRALRRQSYDLNDEGLFNVEYADILGIPFDFTAKPVVVAAAAAPRDHSRESRAARARRSGDPFPRVDGLPRRAAGGAPHREVQRDSRLELTPELVGATQTQMRDHRRKRQPHPLAPARHASVHVLYDLTSHLLYTNGAIPARSRSSTSSASSSASPRSGSTPTSSARAAPIPRSDLQAPGRHGLRAHHCRDQSRGPTRRPRRSRPLLDPYNPVGSTSHVSFNTSKTTLGDRRPPLPHQLGHPRQRLGGGVLPRGGEPSARPRLRQEPQPRASRCPIATAPKAASTGPTSSSSSRTGTARTICFTSWSRSRATGAKTRRTRRSRWRPTGFRA